MSNSCKRWLAWLLLASMWLPAGALAESGLVSYLAWQKAAGQPPAEEAGLDLYYGSEPYHDGASVLDVVLYPSAWPTRELGGVMPEYTGQGWLYELYTMHPVTSNRAEDMQQVEVTFYEYQPEELAAYLDSLLAHGLKTVPVDDLGSAGEDFSAEVKQQWRFASDMCQLQITQATDEIGDFVHIGVFFTREPNTSRRALVPTKLLNAVEWSLKSGLKTNAEQLLGQMDEPYLDEQYGVQVTYCHFPARWPSHLWGDLIPTYQGEGALSYLDVTYPIDDGSDAAALDITQYIYGFKPEEIDQYAADLTAFGYRERPRELFVAEDIPYSEQFETLRIFELPGYTCYVGTLAEDGTTYLQIMLYCWGRHYLLFRQNSALANQWQLC